MKEELNKSQIEKRESKRFLEKSKEQITTAREKINQLLVKLGVLKQKTKAVGLSEMQKIEKEMANISDQNLNIESDEIRKKISEIELKKDEIISQSQNEIKELGVSYRSLGLKDLSPDDAKQMILEVYETLKGEKKELGEGSTAKVYTIKGRENVCFKEIILDEDTLEAIEEMGVNSIEVEMDLQRKAIQAGVRSPEPYIDFVDEKTNRRFLIMETIKGPTLEYLIENPDKLPPDFDLDFFKKCLDQEVEKLQKANLYHRDFFPRNIMVEKHGEKFRPVIIDYGLSTERAGEEDVYVSKNKSGETIVYYQDLKQLDKIKDTIDRIARK